MRSLVEHLRPRGLPEIELYPMESQGPVNMSANTIAAMAATSDKVKVFGLPVPPLAAGTLDEAKGILDYLLRLEPIAEVYRKLKELDIAIFGIAALSDPAAIKRSANYYGVESDVVEAVSKRAVGNLLWQFFDEDGNILDSELHHRIISVTLEQLRDMTRSPDKMVIGIAGGEYKAKALKASILGGFMNTLITDAYTAERLIEIAD